MSNNDVGRLQQFPYTNALLFFTCRHCKISSISSEAFIDASHVVLLDLSFNKIRSEDLNPDIFRGPHSDEEYSPIKLQYLDLSHNDLNYLDKLLFEHTPELRKLDLSYNNFEGLDEGTDEALARLEKLEVLDLSYTGIMELPSALFNDMKHLSELFINGNKFLAVPESLSLVGSTLEILHMSDNPIEIISHESFAKLVKLEQLNISGMPLLTVIEEGVFDPLDSLEVLTCKGNKKLTSIDVKTLEHKKHLKELDLSHNSLTTLNFEVVENATDIYFHHLHKLKLAANPWNCDCRLMKALEVFDHNSTYIKKSINSDEARCETPNELMSKSLYELPKNYYCVADYKQKPLKIPVYDPPQFLRPKSIMLTIFSIAVVGVVGLLIGFAIVCIQRKLKPNPHVDSSNPIRYTAVRDSTISNRASVPYNQA